MKFLSNVLSTIVGLFLFIMIFFFGIVILGVIFGDDETISVKKNSVIELNLKAVSNDYIGKYSDPMMELFSENENIGLSDVLKAIKKAKTDKKIKGISILNNECSLGMAQRKALRDQLEDFKKSGKFIYSYADSYSQKEYYLNSVANKIYINPIGDLDFKGFASEILYFKDFQEKSGIKMEVIRHGKYKSAVEPFLESKMSDANREQMTSLLNSIWNSTIADISKSRNISVEKLNEIANGLLARTADMAKSQGLVDKIAYEDEYHNDIRKILKTDTKDDYNSVKITDYTRSIVNSPLDVDSKNKIAIIYAQGDIKNGEGDFNYIGEGSMRRALEEARKNKNIKAIVLRVNSPGGSALTSELIWREIELTKKTKPIVVSMGNYAASGGYYIACNANRIFAEPNTITGSIGVFGMLPNFTQLTNNKMGINSEIVSTHANSANYSPFRPIDENFKKVTLEGVERIYSTFVNRVATGRKMTVAQVDAIAQGRVWSGDEALKIGLVDQIGGMDEAIKYAASLAKIKTYKTQDFPEYKKNIKQLLSDLPLAKTTSKMMKEEMGEETYLIFEQVKKLNSRKGMQVILPYEININ
ncbi:MAG: signal peptide peptidase SppA [Flavobacterium sp.]